MDLVLLIVLLFFLVLVIGAVWTHLAQASLREMNIGAKLMREKRYPDAEAHFQQLLTKRLPPGVEADTRRRLADTLDVLGKSNEAAAERECAKTIIARNPRDAKAQEARGDLLKRKHQYDEACEAYMLAIGKISMDRPRQAAIMAKLVFAHHEAGRTSEALQWAKKSLANLPSPETHHIMERMAGYGYTDQGDLEEAERHFQEALRLSDWADNREEIANNLSILAGVQHKRGQFQEAIASCHQARKTFAGPVQLSYTIEKECLRDMGCFDEARAVMKQCRLVLDYDQPHLKRRMLALSAFGSAVIEVRADQPDAALAFLEQARSGFEAETVSSDTWPPSPQKGDDKMLLWCDATKSLALAQRGDAQESRRLHESVLLRLPALSGDRNSMSGVYNMLGSAAFALSDLAESKALFQQCLNYQFYPVGLASANHWLGETHLCLGETDAARDFFRQAVAPGIDSLDARRAQARLSELGR